MERNSQKKRLINAVYIALVVFIGILCILAGFLNRENDVKSEFEKADPGKVYEYNSKITVYITGEVESPGLYEIEDGKRVQDAISLAGGFTENADPEGVNLAKILSDGDQVKVPAKKNTSSSKSSKTSGNSNSVLLSSVNINCKDKVKYMTISGITEEIAANIVRYINTNGAFSKVEELQFVEGVTPELYSKIKDKFYK